MANRIDSHFNDFGGIDSRTNQMVQNPKTARDGRNFEFRTDGAQNDFDVLAKRRGFQRKAGANDIGVGLIRYVFRDINTGDQKVQILGVSTLGVLKRLIESEFQITNSSGQTRFYSCFYDETVSLWRIEIRNAANTLLGTVTFNASATLESVKGSLNTLTSSTGLTFSSNPATLNSAILAYFLETKMSVAIASPFIPTIGYREKVYYWENVLTPDGTAPFKYIASGDYANNSEFAGISYVNLNNSVYITDGEFPIKYDGYSAYRAGMPHTVGTKTTTATSTDSSPDGFVLTATTGGSMPSSTTYKYKFQLGFVDPNGFEVLGKINDQMLVALNASQNAVQISVPPIRRSSQFPTFAAKVNGNQNLNNTTLTFNVASGHNIVPGMILRIPVSNSLLGLGGFSYFYPVVNSVTATTITIQSCPFTVPPDNPFSTGSTLRNGQWIQAGFGPSNLNAKVTDPVQKAASLLIPDVLVGAFVRVYRTAGNTDLFYRLIDLPLQYYDGSSSPNDKYNFLDTYPNTGGSGARLSTELLDESEGEELPRACAFLSKWQNQLVQAGRPYNPDSLKNSFYPTNYLGSALVNGWSQPIIENPLYYVTEALLCDSQSVYWSDPLNFEGFPQSGLAEESFETPYADQVSGMGESKDSFFVFKDRSMFILNGELATGNIRKERYETDIGCASHNSIVSVMGGLMWLDATHGFCAVIANQMPRIIGYPVQDWQKTNPFKSSSNQLIFPTARAVNDLIGDKYICYISRVSGDLTFVYDYGEKRNCWYIWSGIEAAGGFIYHQDAVWFGSGDFLWKQKKSGSKYDFSDHTSAIPFIFKSAWINFKAYSIDKKWVQAIIHSARRGFSVLVSQYYNYIDTKEGEILLTFDEASTASPKRTIALNKLKSLSFSLGLENSTINQDVSLNGWEIQFSAEYDKGEAKS